MSPSQHSALRKTYSLRIPHIIYRKLEVLAEQKGLSPSQLANQIIRNAVLNVELSEEDEAIIDQRIREECEKAKEAKDNGKSR